MSEEELPAWSLPAAAVERIALPEEWPGEITRDWAWGGATGAGARVCVLDSGIEDGHPLVGKVQQSVAISIEGDEVIVDDEDTQGDLCGHGTACAGVIRSLAPECDLVSVRVLGAGYTGSGAVLLEGLKWAIEQGYDVINMSLSTTKQKFASLLHELADTAYFQRTMLVASAHNMPVESYPWRFSSVISVGSHEQATIRSSTTTTPRRRLSSSRGASMSRWRGTAAAASSAPETASPPRTSRALPRSSFRSIRS